MLEHCRVLSLTDEKGYLCSRILADLGADVIQIEKPPGDSGRRLGPFWKNIPHPEKSLYWIAYNSNKRSVTLDVTTSDGQAIFRRLAEKAAVLIESFAPGNLDGLGLGYESLSKANPSLVVTSITPFGQAGPYRDYKASDMSLTALGGLMYITGYQDRAPVRISVPQAYLFGGIEAAAATVIALYHREVTGEGQFIDFSLHQSQVMASLNTVSTRELSGANLDRVGTYRTGIFGAQVKYRYLWECKDGYIIFHVYGGLSASKSNKALIGWMKDDGWVDDYLTSIDWNNLETATMTVEKQSAIEEHVARFFLTHTKGEIFEQALKRGMMLGPADSVKDIAQNPQLNARGYWEDVYYPELGAAITHPGAPFKSSTLKFKIRRKAPLPGENNEEIYGGELGISKEQMVMLKQGGII